jgi:hypothetical protein
MIAVRRPYPCGIRRGNREDSGTSIEMIERSYGLLLIGAAAGIAERLAAFEAEQERAAETSR